MGWMSWCGWACVCGLVYLRMGGWDGHRAGGEYVRYVVSSSSENDTDDLHGDGDQRWSS